MEVQEPGCLSPTAVFPAAAAAALAAAPGEASADRR